MFIPFLPPFRQSARGFLINFGLNMKRAATYLIGAIATLAILISTHSAWIPSSGSGSLQPDDGGSRGYILELYSDSLFTVSAPGRQLLIITPDTLIASLPDSLRSGGAFPRLHTGSPIFDAAWMLAVCRLSATPATPFNIVMAPVCTMADRDTPSLARSLISGNDGKEAWPLADPERLMRIIALGRLSLGEGSETWVRSAIDFATRALSADSSRLFRSDYGLWAGGGDPNISGALPEWMTPSDRFNTISLTVNALAADAYASLAVMKRIAGDDDTQALHSGHELAQAINDHLWLPSKGFYSQYLCGRLMLMKSPAASGLGNALAAASRNIASEEMARRVVAGLPRTPYGITRSMPIPHGADAETESSVGQGLWASACHRAANVRALWNAFSVLLRSVSLTAIGEQPDSPEIWGAYTGAVTGLIFGLNPTDRGLEINPVVPSELSGEKTLEGLPYNNAILDITIIGTGSKVATMLLDGLELRGHTVPASLSGRHSLRIEMRDNPQAEQPSISVIDPVFLTSTPTLAWESVSAARDTIYSGTPTAYARFHNGIRLEDIPADAPTIPFRRGSGYSEWIAMPVDDAGYPSGMMSEPKASIPREVSVLIQAEWFKARELARDVYRRMLRHWRRLKACRRADDTSRPNPRLTQIVELTSAQELTFTAEAPVATDCVAIIGYADGRDAGSPGMTLRSLSINGERVATLPMPRAGIPADTTVTLTTSPVKIKLDKGLNKITLSTTLADLNPNRTADTVMIDFLRLVPID